MNEERKDDQLNAETNKSLDVGTMSEGDLPGQNEITESEVSNEELAEARKYGYKTQEELEAEGKKITKIKTPHEFIEYGKRYDREKALEAKLKRIEDQNQ